jgi:transposase
VDECGFCEKPLVKRAWAPRGQTPTLEENGSWGKLTAIGALSWRPSGRLNEQFQLLRGGAKTLDFIWFLRAMYERYRKKLIVVWDHLSAHQKAARLLQKLEVDWAEFIWLPTYSPELNPVEWLWNTTKYHELAKYAPRDMRELTDRVEQSLRRPRRRQSLLKSFFRGAGLSIEPITT